MLIAGDAISNETVDLNINGNSLLAGHVCPFANEKLHKIIIMGNR
jgi:hypothetical protein